MMRPENDVHRNRNVHRNFIADRQRNFFPPAGFHPAVAPFRWSLL
jgi:hypothetical protein